MAKRKRNTDSSAFTDAVEASAEKDELDGTGTVIEGGGPVHLVKLTEQERAAAGEHLASLLHDLAEVEQEAKDAAAAKRKDIKTRRKAIAELREEVLSGVRKEDAQPALPGVDG
jgi:hypothetical protein